jgi:hypothetical protein
MKIVISWDVAPYRGRCGKISFLFDSEDVGRKFFTDAGELSSDYTASHLRRHSSATSDPTLIQMFYE